MRPLRFCIFVLFLLLNVPVAAQSETLTRAVAKTVLVRKAAGAPVLGKTAIDMLGPGDVTAAPPDAKISPVGFDSVEQALLLDGLTVRAFRKNTVLLLCGAGGCWDQIAILTGRGQTEASHWPHPDVVTYQVPLGSLRIEDITGIQQPDATHATVYFTWTIVPNLIGKLVSPAVGFTVLARVKGEANWELPFSTSPQKGVWKFILFDDGWRA
jgi:hypothetical protein